MTDAGARDVCPHSALEDPKIFPWLAGSTPMPLSSITIRTRSPLVSVKTTTCGGMPGRAHFRALPNRSRNRLSKRWAVAHDGRERFAEMDGVPSGRDFGILLDQLSYGACEVDRPERDLAARQPR